MKILHVIGLSILLTSNLFFCIYFTVFLMGYDILIHERNPYIAGMELILALYGMGYGIYLVRRLKKKLINNKA